jgi:subtilisin family serine protease
VAIFAAGNSNSPAPFFPAAYPGVIGVASTNRTDGKSYFSNYGHWVSISAPGTDVFSTDVNNSYATASGTSMACPHVSGVAALVASKGYGQLTAAEVKEIILYSTDNHYFVNPDYLGKLGTGRLNAYNALLETNATLNNIANPSSFKASSSDPNTILLEWNNNGNNDDVLIVWALQPINGTPVNGTIYSAGQALPGGGTVLVSRPGQST